MLFCHTFFPLPNQYIYAKAISYFYLASASEIEQITSAIANNIFSYLDNTYHITS